MNTNSYFLKSTHVPNMNKIFELDFHNVSNSINISGKRHKAKLSGPWNSSQKKQSSDHTVPENLK